MAEPAPLQTAGEHATARVPVARPGDTAGAVRSAIAGAAYDSADDVAVLDGRRLVGIVPIETLIAAVDRCRSRRRHRGADGRGPARGHAGRGSGARRLSVPFADEDSGVASIRGEIRIKRPVDEVFDFVADERNVYDPRIVRAEKLSAGPVGAGSRFRSETETMGRSVSMIIETTAHERPRLLASVTRLSSMEIESTLSCEPVPEGTRMRWLSDVRPRGVLKLLTPVIAIIARRQAEGIWGHLKKVLETRGASPTANHLSRPLP
jgi:hypothetical protein